jgi:hypothetical protein
MLAAERRACPCWRLETAESTQDDEVDIDPNDHLPPKKKKAKKNSDDEPDNESPNSEEQDDTEAFARRVVDATEK